MHRSRLSAVCIDCRDVDGTDFWSAALGMKATRHDGYVALESGDLGVDVQRVTHESRVHLDFETDDEAAEVARLEKLGAKQVARVKTWTIMEAPTGQRFCVCQAKRSLDGLPGINTWP